MPSKPSTNKRLAKCFPSSPPRVAGSQHRPKFSLNSHDLDGLLQTFERIAPRRWPEFVRDVSCIAEAGDGLRDEAVVELLRVIDLMTAGHAAGVEMPDPLEILLDVAADVAVHDLQMINVAKNLDTRRIDALDNVDSPGEMIADLILSAEARVLQLAVHHFHADGDGFVLGARLDAIEERDCVVGALGVGHTAALAADNDDVGVSGGGNLVDGCAES